MPKIFGSLFFVFSCHFLSDTIPSRDQLRIIFNEIINIACKIKTD